MDRELAIAALEKRKRGEQPSTKELAALRRVDKAREEMTRWQYYAAIPKRHWVQMSGRQVKVINEQAARYKLPIGEKTINLPAFVRAVHDFLAGNARALARQVIEDDPMLASGGDSPEMRRYRAAKASLAELDLDERRQTLLPRERVHQALFRWGTLIRRMGERLTKRYGPEIAGDINDTLAACARVIDSELGPDDSSSTEPSGPASD